MPDPLVVAEAIRYLHRETEVVKPAGLGLWLVNGLPQTANDLRHFDALVPLTEAPTPRRRRHG